MADIRVLPSSLAELIAAGEVVERPASVIKELIENSIDAGAKRITVEIQRGGITYMRVTDDGCGISASQVPTAFLRHATSKIKDEKDLFKIATLGFRGEALASVGAVARVELMTKTENEEIGTRYVMEGGIEKEYSETGCPKGTTIIVRDLFYNTPARMKFLKKDSSEATAVASLLDAISLSHPEISFKLIKDSKLILTTPGDGKLESACYTVLGREFASGLIPADSTTAGIRVSGMIIKPIYCRSSRSGQYVFLNNRFIRSGVVAKALDQAYKSSIMVGKFPACVLNIELPFDRVDVNVHPAKTEVRFSDEKAIFEAVYYAAKNALLASDTRPELEIKTTVKPKTPAPFERMSTEEYKARFAEKENKPTPAETVYSPYIEKKPSAPIYDPPKRSEPIRSALSDFTAPLVSDNPVVLPDYSVIKKTPEPVKAPEPTPVEIIVPKTEVKEKTIYEQVISALSDGDETYETASFLSETEVEFKYIGEAFRTYILVQYKGSLWFIDKHAAHERILYEKLKSEGVVEVQTLLSPVSVTLSREEYRVVCDNLELLASAGFEIEEFGTVSVLVRAVPACLIKTDVMVLICDIAANLVKYGTAETEILDDLYHNIACRAAIKGGNAQSDAELEKFAKEILSSNDILYCPHGRPVAFELKRSQIEKQFGRTK